MSLTSLETKDFNTLQENKLQPPTRHRPFISFDILLDNGLQNPPRQRNTPTKLKTITPHCPKGPRNPSVSSSFSKTNWTKLSWSRIYGNKILYSQWEKGRHLSKKWTTWPHQRKDYIAPVFPKKKSASPVQTDLSVSDLCSSWGWRCGCSRGFLTNKDPRP